jgi:hypothetical protein
MAENHVDTESMPKTEAYTPTFDTGAHPTAEPGIIETNTPPRRRRRWWRRSAVAQDAADTSDDTALIAAPQASSVSVPSRYQYLKWWKFILMLLAVWVPAGGVGAGLFYWWSHDNSKTKTAVVFVVLVYVVACTIAGLMLAMVPDRPMVSALAIAMISAVFAAVVGAAPLYGHFYCEHSQRQCLMQVLPY